MSAKLCLEATYWLLPVPVLAIDWLWRVPPLFGLLNWKVALGRKTTMNSPCS